MPYGSSSKLHYNKMDYLVSEEEGEDKYVGR